MTGTQRSTRGRNLGLLLTGGLFAALALAGCNSDPSHVAPAGSPTQPTAPATTTTGPTQPVTPTHSATPTEHHNGHHHNGQPGNHGHNTGDDTRPNIVFISTDDQRLSDMQWMPYTRHLLGDHGVTFTDALSPHPLCCPARAEFMTGQYGQNNGVHHNEGVYGGFKALKDPGNTLGTWLDDAGYQTAMVGKYLNGYPAYSDDPSTHTGWDHWNPTVGGVYSYNNTTFYNDGDPHHTTRHVDDVVTSYAENYIREFSTRNAPFYVWASDLAPHDQVLRSGAYPPIPAARHRNLFADVPNTALTDPAYGKRILHGPRRHLDEEGLAHQQTLFTARIRALQAVDEGVRNIVDTLRETGELDNTYIIFTTDNGYLLGEHGLTAKNFLYEQALRVPLLVRTPGATTPSTSPVPVTAVDIAPTVAELADASPERLTDGQSFVPLLRGDAIHWRDSQLVQTGYASTSTEDPGWKERGVRTDRWTYGHNFTNDTYELYDRVNDPNELVNLAYSPRYTDVMTELEHRAAILETCAGDVCRQDFGPDPQPAPRH